MVEELENIEKFPHYEDKAKIYGTHFLERLQDKHPQKTLVGVVAPGYSQTHKGDSGDSMQSSTFCFVGEITTFYRRGLKKLLFGNSGKDLRVSVKLNRNRYDASGGCAVIYDADLRRPAARIMAELDGRSGEVYSSNITYSNEPDFLQLESRTEFL